MNKRVVSVFLLVLVLASLLINLGFVSAEDDFGKDFNIEEIGEGFKPILLFLFNMEKDADKADIAQTLFSFVIAFVIVFVFVLIAFKNLPFFDENRGLSYFIVVVATLLGIRGIAQISPGIMNDIFLPYSALALSIINGAAIVGWFMLVNVGMNKRNDLKFVRRFLWILFAVTFIGIWGMRTFFVSGETKPLTSLTQWIYGGTIILSLIIAIMDGSIQGIFLRMKADKLKHINKTKELADYQEEKKRYRDAYKNGNMPVADYKQLMNNLYQRVLVTHGKQIAKQFKHSPK